MTFNPKIYGVADRYIQHYAPLVILGEGQNVLSVTIDTSYPPEQKQEEERELAEDMKKKRREQQIELCADYRLMAHSCLTDNRLSW